MVQKLNHLFLLNRRGKAFFHPAQNLLRGPPVEAKPAAASARGEPARQRGASLLGQFVLQHPHSPGGLTPQAARCHPASQLSGEEVVSVADVIRSLRATGIWSASP